MLRNALASAIALLLFVALGASAAPHVNITIPTNASPRVVFAAERLGLALQAAGLQGTVGQAPSTNGPSIRFRQRTDLRQDLGHEGFRLESSNNILTITAAADSGLLYGAVDAARRIREERRLPQSINVADTPAMALRGVCVAMQKTSILPGRRVYEYPYTPELFPWFYDKQLWSEYLDVLVENRMNSLYLWNGHPFASLVRLKEYPEAVEVPDDVFEKNVEMFRWLTTECDKRGIWLVQMFYNIFLPKPLAEKHGVPTQLSAPTPLSSDYTRKSIAEFVKQYPNVGLMVCLGEALQGTTNQISWATSTILPGVLDGMKAAGLREQPPVVIRTHAMNPEAIMPACFAVYTNLFTETKYNGESLTTYEPRGKAAQTHLNMAALGSHIVNVHILSNLEPFRYGAQEFIRKSILASRDRFGASGLHLYPLAYWNWPNSPDATTPPLKQWDRDWMWFEAWARYAWNPDVNLNQDRAYWISRLTAFLGTRQAAEKMLDAVNEAGEVAPQLVRRFGITEGNRQTLSLGMTLDQLVNPKRYNAITELWESQAPPGERLDEFVRKEWSKEAHIGETPVSVIEAVLKHASNAVVFAAAAAPHVTENQAEFKRWRNDFACILAMAQNYEHKTKAAAHVLRYGFSKDMADMNAAGEHMTRSLERFRELTALTRNTYQFANSMQTGHRKIPFGGAANGAGTNYHWVQVLPLYEKELADFRVALAELKDPARATSTTAVQPWPAAPFRLISTNAETYEVKAGARPFVDRRYTFMSVASELNGLTGIRFSHEEAKNHRHVPIEFEVTQPVRVLIGYFQNERDLWLQVPNLDFASHADERGGVEPVLRNAGEIEECPAFNVHAFRYEPGRHQLELIGKGSFIVLGVVPQSATLEKRDAKLGTK
ncbi:MAG TPA: hypothetical protein VEH04_04695 [Verrucomicrobiae bacterium]|nr:hypothetical protein [Verrucomicrobiae bacterium]